MFDPTNQYRCTIIRGKTQSEMEDLLPAYANMVHNNCPCTKAEFDTRCCRKLSLLLFQTSDFDSLPDNNKKTVRNHLTEIAGSLLGLYFEDTEGYVHESQSCAFLLEKNDFPAFFRNLCLHFQFPNGTQKIQTVIERVEKGIRLKPLCYIIALLDYASRQEKNILLSKQEIGYYVLNALEVLQGKISCQEVYNKILDDRSDKVVHHRLSGSYDWQHIKEQLNLLDLADLTKSDAEYIWLNKTQDKAIRLFIKELQEPFFEVGSFDLTTRKGKTEFYSAWGEYYGRLNSELAAIETSFTSQEDTKPIRQRGAVGLTTSELGDKGEALVYRLEYERIKAYKERLVNKVLLLGKTKGLGYDISSLEGDENPSRPEFARYIEVKSTTRISEPSFDAIWSDSLNLTSKEWVAAEQYGAYYNIYRVYFTRTKTIVVRIQNPFELAQTEQIEVFPTIYQMNFGANVITKRYEEDCI
ncbi:MAG: DUF3883 domain-containing protein [Bacteroidales bacterium]|nr:DUF3883 domain-containing protein [Bacteroidales bacterium]